MPQSSAPRSTVGSELRPRCVRDVEVVERLADSAAVRELWRAARPRRSHPRGEHTPRQPLERHAHDVPSPAQQPPVDIRVDVVEPQPLLELLRRDVMLDATYLIEHIFLALSKHKHGVAL